MSDEQRDLFAVPEGGLAASSPSGYLEALDDARAEREQTYHSDVPLASGPVQVPFLGEYTTRLTDREIELGHRRVAELRAQIDTNRAARKART